MFHLLNHDVCWQDSGHDVHGEDQKTYTSSLGNPPQSKSIEMHCPTLIQLSSIGILADKQ